jgi:hypothetical protein
MDKLSTIYSSLLTAVSDHISGVAGIPDQGKENSFFFFHQQGNP